MNKSFHAKVDNKSVTMNPVKNFLQEIVSGKFNDEKEAKEWYKSTVYENEKKRKKKKQILKQIIEKT